MNVPKSSNNQIAIADLASWATCGNTFGGLSGASWAVLAPSWAPWSIHWPTRKPLEPSWGQCAKDCGFETGALRSSHRGW
eukprot:1661446-Pyramimonas_sp.AAC.1